MYLLQSEGKTVGVGLSAAMKPRRSDADEDASTPSEPRNSHTIAGRVTRYSCFLASRSKRFVASSTSFFQESSNSTDRDGQGHVGSVTKGGGVSPLLRTFR